MFYGGALKSGKSEKSVYGERMNGAIAKLTLLLE
jgi:hypothetical protein